MSASTILSLEPADVAWRMNPSRVSVVKAVGRRMVPYLIEATLIPMALFYLFFIMFELKWAIVAALGWTYAAMGRRIVTGRPFRGLLVLATLGISVRTVIYLLSGNDFVYFFQPIMRTVATAAVFALSVRIGRPLVARFADDFCPISPDVQEPPRGRPAVPPAHLPVGGGQRGRRRGDLDATADTSGRCLRRHGRRSRRGSSPAAASCSRCRTRSVRRAAKGSTLRYPPTGDCTPTFPLPTEVASQLA